MGVGLRLDLEPGLVIKTGSRIVQSALIGQFMHAVQNIVYRQGQRKNTLIYRGWRYVTDM
jgi:hypothetical protein